MKTNTRRLIALLLLSASVGLLWFGLRSLWPAWVAWRRGSDPAPYADRDWSTGSQSPMNISVFVFRDLDRDGVYDVGDLPMSSVAVRLTRPDGSVRSRSSNIHGYTNFKMRLAGGSGADVTIADAAYVFEVLQPPGWQITTGNTRQSSRFVRLPGSISGLIAAPPPGVVGMAPDLTVHGRLRGAGSEGEPQDPGVVLTAFGPARPALEVTPGPDGAFAFPAIPGEWSLRVEDRQTNRTRERAFEVRDAPVVLSAIDLGEERAEPLGQEVLQDFEYLQRAVIDKIPNGNRHLNWDYLLAVEHQYYAGPGYVNTLVSGRTVAYNSSGHPVTITPPDTTPGFDFVGAYFGAAWPEAQGEILVVEAWRAGTRFAHEEIPLSYLGPIWFAADYRSIDRLTLATRHYWQFVTDDMRFRIAAADLEGDPKAARGPDPE